MGRARRVQDLRPEDNGEPEAVHVPEPQGLLPGAAGPDQPAAAVRLMAERLCKCGCGKPVEQRPSGSGRQIEWADDCRARMESKRNTEKSRRRRERLKRQREGTSP